MRRVTVVPYDARWPQGFAAASAEVAAVAAFLASEDASFVTGHALVVDGGYTIGMRTELLDGLGLT